MDKHYGMTDDDLLIEGIGNPENYRLGEIGGIVGMYSPVFFNLPSEMTLPEVQAVSINTRPPIQ